MARHTVMRQNKYNEQTKHSITNPRNLSNNSTCTSLVRCLPAANKCPMVTETCNMQTEANLISKTDPRLTGLSNRTVGTRIAPKCGREKSRPGQLSHAILLEGPNRSGHRHHATMPTLRLRVALQSLETPLVVLSHSSKSPVG